MNKINLTGYDIFNLQKYSYHKTKLYEIFKLPDGKMYKIITDYQKVYGNSTNYQDLIEYFEKANLQNLDYPTGVLYYNGKEVGYESKFHENYKTFDIDNKSLLEFYKFQHKIIDLLEHLHNNGILYFDFNYENFLVSEDSEEIKLIDFEPVSIDINVTKDSDLSRFFLFLQLNLQFMYSVYYGIEDKIEVNSFDEVRHYLDERINEFKNNNIRKNK